MNKREALDKLKSTRELSTNMLDPLGVTFEQFLRFAQLNTKTAEKAIDLLINRTEKEVS